MFVLNRSGTNRKNNYNLNYLQYNKNKLQNKTVCNKLRCILVVYKIRQFKKKKKMGSNIWLGEKGNWVSDINVYFSLTPIYNRQIIDKV